MWVKPIGNSVEDWIFHSCEHEAYVKWEKKESKKKYKWISREKKKLEDNFIFSLPPWGMFGSRKLFYMLSLTQHHHNNHQKDDDALFPRFLLHSSCFYVCTIRLLHETFPTSMLSWARISSRTSRSTFTIINNLFIRCMLLIMLIEHQQDFTLMKSYPFFVWDWVHFIYNIQHEQLSVDEEHEWMILISRRKPTSSLGDVFDVKFWVSINFPRIFIIKRNRNWFYRLWNFWVGVVSSPQPSTTQ